MQVLKPVTFDTSQLISTNAVETTPDWVSTTTYAVGALVKYTTGIYESLVGGNLNKQPNLFPNNWLLKGPTNTNAMFDLQVSSQTTRENSLTVVVKPNKVINSLAFLNLDGTALDVVVRDGLTGPIIYTNTANLDGTLINDWSMYFFEEFNPRTEVVFTDIPLYLNAHITATLSGGGTVKLGAMTYGTLYNLGLTQYGLSSGILDYSIKQTDDFGNTTFLQRAFSKRLEANVMMPNSALSFNQRLLTELRATPVVWISSQESEYQSLVVFGFYREFNIDIAYPTYSMCSLTIEGLT